MTTKMEQWDEAFHAWLSELDLKYAAYFASQEANRRSIVFYFGTLNGGNLQVVDLNLREDIYQDVVAKHKEIWGELHRLDVLRGAG